MAAVSAAVWISIFRIGLRVVGIGAVCFQHHVHCGNAELLDRCVWLSHCCADAWLACRCLRPRVKHCWNHFFCIFENYWEVCSWSWYGLCDDSDRHSGIMPWQYQHGFHVRPVGYYAGRHHVGQLRNLLSAVSDLGCVTPTHLPCGKAQYSRRRGRNTGAMEGDAARARLFRGNPRHRVMRGSHQRFYVAHHRGIPHMHTYTHTHTHNTAHIHAHGIPRAHATHDALRINASMSHVTEVYHNT